MNQKDLDLKFELNYCKNFSSFNKIIDKFRSEKPIITIKDLLVYAPESETSMKEVHLHLSSYGIDVPKSTLVEVLNEELKVATIRKGRGAENVMYLKDVSTILPEVTSEGLTNSQKAQDNLIKFLISVGFSKKQITVAYHEKHINDELHRVKTRVDSLHKLYNIDDTSNLETKRGIIEPEESFHILKTDSFYYPDLPDNLPLYYLEGLASHRNEMFCLSLKTTKINL